MYQYNSAGKLTNEWRNMVNQLNSTDNTQIVIKFVEQLKADLENLKQNLPVSECAYNTPRLNGKVDKQTRFTHQIAYMLRPIDPTKDFESDKTNTYINCQKIISKLSHAFVDQLEKKEDEKNAYKKIRGTHERKNFCELKKKPIHDFVLNPKPMPVDVAPIEELEPFFNHLASNKEVLPTVSKSMIELPIVSKSMIEFKRGVQYSDGRMDLCKQVVGPPHISKLMEALKDNTQITHFLLGNNIIGINGATAISKFIEEHKNNSQIKTWYLAGNEIDAEGSKLLSDALKDDTVCEALWLKRNPIKAEGAQFIGKLMEVNKHIKILDLHNTGLLDEGTQYIMESLQKNTTLRHLYLDANGITEKGASYVADYFNYMVKHDLKGISSLWIDMNRIDDEGMIEITNALYGYKHLKRLIVGSNRLTDVSVGILCNTLVNSKTLKVLDLGLYKATADIGELPNNLMNIGAEYIANFIRNNKSVEVLSVLHNNIGIEGIKLLEQALLTNDNISWLYYEQYGLDIPQTIRMSFKNKFGQNIKKKYNMSIEDFCNHKLKYIKGSKKLKNIDSIYRNRM